MRKIFLFLILLCWFATSVCRPVDRERAQQVAVNFWSAVVGESENNRWNEVSSEFGFQQFYVFAREGSAGFVLVSADDCVQPILGYSTKSVVSTTIPEHVSSFLQGYEAEIAYCKAHQIMPTEEISSQWSSLIQGTYTMQNTASVSPLLPTTWAQSPYYNDLCPEQGGVHAVTGCVATALAQVMKYWNWPINGMGSHSYQDATYGTLSANFGATTYNWSDMPVELTENSTPAQINAVATIMYHVGVAVEMEYGEEESSSYLSVGGNSTIPSGENALKDYFRFKSTLHDLNRSSVSSNVWISTLMNELNAGRPVLERGSGSAGGHAFVCDGYDANGLFHINWGWGGYLDGYFAHNALNPGSGGYDFNDGKTLVVGIEPEWRIDVTPMQLSFEQAGGTETLTVSSYSEDTSVWNATTNVSWLSLTPTNGPGSGATTTISVTAIPNNSNSTRYGEITITQGAQMRIVRVVQYSYSHIITLISSDADMGSVTGGGSYVSGATVGLQANANSGYRFTGWSDGSTENPRSLSVTEDISLTAYFADLGDDEKQYDNGDYETSLGAGSSFKWGVRYPANELAPYPYLSAIKIMDFHSGSCEVRIYQGGTTAPQTLVATYNFTLPGSDTWYDMVLPTPLQIDHTLPLWIVLNSTDISHPAAGTNYAGNTDGSWVCLGSSWSSICNSGYNLTWMVRAKLSEESNPTQFTVTATASNADMGSVTGGGTYVSGATVGLQANANSGYRFTGWSDGSTENPRFLSVTEDISLTAYFADLGDDEKQYDNGNYETSLGAGSSFKWGVRYPANELAPYPYLSAIKIMDFHSGSCEVRIYQGGTTAPQTLVATYNFTLPGSDSWHEMVLPAPLQIDHTLPLWIVLNSTDITHPAAGTNYAGNPDGSWVCLGSSWSSICNSGYNLTWMVRAKLSEESNPTQFTVTATASNADMGSVTGGGTYVTGSTVELQANANSGYRFTGWSDGSTENPRSLSVTEDISLTAYFADLGDDEKQYDNGDYETSLGAGSSFKWGVRYPANELAPYPYLSAIKIMDFHSGSCEVRIYQGGTTEPQTLVATHNFTLPGSDSWHEMVLPAPLQIDHTLPLWIVLNSTDITHPAAGTNYAGNPDGSWVCLGSSWSSICNSGYNLTWMVRAKLSGATSQQYTISAHSSDTSLGSVTGGGTYESGTNVTLTATPSECGRFVQWLDGETMNPRTVTVTCDSSFMAIFEEDIVYTTDNKTACEEYVWNGQVYTTSGTYTQTFTTTNGCDSIVTLHLTVNYGTYNAETETACDSYTWHGETYTTSGTYTYEYNNASGCASVDTLHLTVNYGTYNAETETACDIYTWHGEAYTTSGTYTYEYNNASGCASVDTLHLTVNHPQHQAFFETQYDTYTWNGQVYTTSGIYLHSHTDANGCTQVDTLYLTIYNSSSNEFYITACESYEWDGSIYTQSGSYTKTYTDIHGADSVMTLHLTINHGTYNAETETACDSYTWHGETYTTSGTYTYEYNNASGCASVDTLHLTVNHPQHQAFFETQYDTYTWNGQVYTTSGIYLHSHTDANGCTQVDTLYLTIYNSSSNEFYITACESYEWDGSIYTQSGSYTKTYTDIHGADSVMTLHLTINHGTYNAETETACDIYTWHGEAYTTSGTYTYEYNNASGCASVDTLHLTIHSSVAEVVEDTACEEYVWNGQVFTTSGTYTQTFTTTNGCDSIVTLQLTINHGTYNAETETACDSYTWHGETYTTSGTYTYEYDNASGCASVDTLHLTIHQSSNTEFSVTVEESYEWNGEIYTQSGDYEQIFVDQNGCDSVVTLHLLVTVAIDELNIRNLNIYPNPTSHELTVEGVTFATLELYDNVGKRIATWHIGDESATLDLSPFSAGIYYLRVVDSAGAVETRKVVKRQ